MPAVYYLEQPKPVAFYLALSLLLASAWVVIDIASRVKSDWVRLAWLFLNVAYAIPLLAIVNGGSPVVAAWFLLGILAVDLLLSNFV